MYARAHDLLLVLYLDSQCIRYKLLPCLVLSACLYMWLSMVGKGLSYFITSKGKMCSLLIQQTRTPLAYILAHSLYYWKGVYVSLCLAFSCSSPVILVNPHCYQRLWIIYVLVPALNHHHQIPFISLHTTVITFPPLAVIFYTSFMSNLLLIHFLECRSNPNSIVCGDGTTSLHCS